MITEEQLKTLCQFGREENGDYSDRWQFTIRLGLMFPMLYLFDEVDGNLSFIKMLKDFDDLKNVYKAITNKELEICKN